LENELAAMRLEANQRHEQSNQRHEQSNQRHEQYLKQVLLGRKRTQRSVNSLGSKKVEFGTSSVLNGTNNSFRVNENNRNVNSGLNDDNELVRQQTDTAGTNFKANDYRFKKLKMPIFDGEDA
ncbi:hypothetical protein Tco_0082335, partial [Tanacetum coccineum]